MAFWLGILAWHFGWIPGIFARFLGFSAASREYGEIPVFLPLLPIYLVAIPGMPVRIPVFLAAIPRIPARIPGNPCWKNGKVAGFPGFQPAFPGFQPAFPEIRAGRTGIWPNSRDSALEERDSALEERALRAVVSDESSPLQSGSAESSAAQSEVQDIVNKLDELITAMRR